MNTEIYLFTYITIPGRYSFLQSKTQSYPFFHKVRSTACFLKVYPFIEIEFETKIIIIDRLFSKIFQRTTSKRKEISHRSRSAGYCWKISCGATKSIGVAATETGCRCCRRGGNYCQSGKRKRRCSFSWGRSVNRPARCWGTGKLSKR